MKVHTFREYYIINDYSHKFRVLNPYVLWLRFWQCDRKSLRHRFFSKFGMIEFKTNSYDLLKPIKDIYWNLAFYLYRKGKLNIMRKEGDTMPINWFKYIKWN